MRVDILLPAIRDKYEFELPDNKEIRLLIPEIVENVCNKEHRELKGNTDDTILFHADKKKILDKNQTLISAGVKNGDRLIIV